MTTLAALLFGRQAGRPTCCVGCVLSTLEYRAVSCQPLSTTDCFHMLEVPQGSSVAVQLSKAITLFSWVCISAVVDCILYFY
jgi:hypothetical protein